MDRFGRSTVMALGAALAACATPVASGPTGVTSCAEQVRARTLCQFVVVDATPADVWPLIATSEGWRSWATPVAHVDLRVGGEIETSYDPNAQIGAPGNIHNRIEAFSPERLLVIRIAQAPPRFPHAEEARTVTTEIALEPQGSRTLVRVTMGRFAEGEAYDELYRFFDAGNAYTLNKLVERIENGPTNWAEQR